MDRDALARDLGAYRPDMGPTNRDLVLQHHGPRDHAIALLEALPERPMTARPDGALRELARLTALGWSWEQTAREFRTTFWPLQAHTVEVEARAKETAAWANELERQRDAALQRVAELEQNLNAQRRAGALRRLRRRLRP